MNALAPSCDMYTFIWSLQNTLLYNVQAILFLEYVYSMIFR